MFASVHVGRRRCTLEYPPIPHRTRPRKGLRELVPSLEKGELIRFPRRRTWVVIQKWLGGSATRGRCGYLRRCQPLSLPRRCLGRGSPLRGCRDVLVIHREKF